MVKNKKQLQQKTKKTNVQKPARKTFFVYYIFIFLIAFVAYANTFKHGYVLDDFSVIKENFVVKQGTAGISTILKTGYRYGYWNSPDNLYRPLPLIMYAIEWQLWPDNPTPGHVINVLLFGLLCVLLFKLLQKLFAGYSVLLPMMATLIFALHPIHTEVVANIKSRDEIMAFLFSIGSILLLLSYSEKKSTLKLITALFIYLLALLSKESAITFLAIIPFLFYFFYDKKKKSAAFLTVFYLIPVLIFFAMRYRAIGNQAHLDETSMVDNLLVAAPDFFTRTATAIKIMGLYLWKLMVPYPLACDYSYNQIKIVNFGDFYVLISLFVYICLAVIAFLGFKKKSVLSFSVLFYFISMSIYSNLIITIGSSFGERFLFVPSFAFALALAYLITKLFGMLQKEINLNQLFTSKVFLTLLPLFIIYIGITMSRNKDWKSSLSLYEADINKSPESAHMNYYYGLEIMKGKAMENGEVTKPEYLDTAIFYFRRARTIVPSFADAYDQLGLAYFRKNEWDKALAYYDTCLTLAPGKSITYSNMGVIYFQNKQYDKALAAYENAVRFDPKFSDGWMNLGSTYGTLGKYNEAIAAFKKCIEYNPQNAMAYYFIGITYQNLGDPSNASYFLNQAYALNPSLKGKQ
ncbi:MAG TPA: tetratricopeptide repeat protein [Bacteroidales bacterium]|nr:tetratricopeptide repeat protein [Bacteroidales bacterium]